MDLARQGDDRALVGESLTARAGAPDSLGAAQPRDCARFETRTETPDPGSLMAHSLSPSERTVGRVRRLAVAPHARDAQSPPGSGSAPRQVNDRALIVSGLGVAVDGVQILSGVSFEVTAGETLAVFGPNGAGKTMLFRALIGAVPHQGSIRWAPGTRLGYVPQKLDVERDLPITGADLLRAKLHLTRSPGEDTTEALARVGLTRDVAYQPIGAMSGGQFQRLLVACALIGTPNVLLLDEPAAGVDAPGQEALDAALDRLRREGRVTTLLISHDLSVVYRYASTVLCLAPHQAYVGKPENVLAPARLAALYGRPVGFHLREHDGR